MPKFLHLVVLLPVLVSPAKIPRVVGVGITPEDVKEVETLVALGESGNLPLLSSPLKVTEDQVSFYVYNKNDYNSQEVLISQAGSIASLSDFDTSLATIFLIHGWHDTYQSSFDTNLAKAYKSGMDVNVISVNWDEPAQLGYLESYSAVPEVGEFTGQFIKSVSLAYDYPLEKISIVGHSLGAQIAGFAGKETNGSIHSITGLDAAGPLYFKINPAGRLDKGDAQYVEAVHTNAGFLGVNYNIGDSDFWPNGGQSQPGCGTDVSCSHGRSCSYFTESVGSSGFVAKACGTYEDYTEGLCQSAQSAVMGGAELDTGAEGTYYLQTNSVSPYALGDV